MNLPMSRLTPEYVAHLKEGDYIEAWFERTERDRYGMDEVQPTGVTYQLKGTLVAHHGYEDPREGLSMSDGSGMVVRQIDGKPGDWLVSISKHVPVPDPS